jgi:chromosome segregation ATPase
MNMGTDLKHREEVHDLEAKIARLRGENDSLVVDKMHFEAENASLRADLKTAKDALTSHQLIIASVSSELKTAKDALEHEKYVTCRECSHPQVEALQAERDSAIAERDSALTQSCTSCSTYARADQLTAKLLDARQEVRAALDANVECQRTIAILRAEMDVLEGQIIAQHWCITIISDAAVRGGRERE